MIESIFMEFITNGIQGTLGVITLGKHVHLFSERRPDLSVSVSVYIHPETRDLVIAGHDVGEFIKNFSGDSGFDYWVIIPAHEKVKLLIDLQEKGFGGRKWQPWVSDDIRLLSAVKARFGGNNAIISEVQKYCEEIGVRTEFHSY